MGEHNKVIIEHYPAEKLPEELRPGIDTSRTVRVTVEPEPKAAPGRALSPLLGTARGTYNEEEAVSFIRRLRDE